MGTPASPSRAAAERQLWQGFGDAWSAVSTIIAGIAVWGAVGFGLDRLLGTWPGFFAGGVMLGNFAAIYLLYVRATREMDSTKGRHAA